MSSRLIKMYDNGGNIIPPSERFSDSEDIRWSIKESAIQDIHNVLQGQNYQDEIYLADVTPSIISSQKGAKNLPLVMKPSHIIENILTEEEAKAKGLKTDKWIHFHGIGEENFINIINDLDNVSLAYRGTKNAKDSSRRENYFLLISNYEDEKGNKINVPGQINQKGKYNNLFIDVNKVATVFGRDNLEDYLRKQVVDGNFVRIKNRSNQVSESLEPKPRHYNSNASTNNVPHTDTESQAYSLKNLSSNFNTEEAEDYIKKNI